MTAEAGLAFLGIGVVGVPSWGQTINKAVNFFNTYPLYLYAPVLGILVLVMALNLLGDAVRDAFDPKTRRYSHRSESIDQPRKVGTTRCV